MKKGTEKKANQTFKVFEGISQPPARRGTRQHLSAERDRLAKLKREQKPKRARR